MANNLYVFFINNCLKVSVLHIQVVTHIYTEWWLVSTKYTSV